MTDTAEPARGEVWQANLNPTKGHEQSGVRPVLVVSVDIFNSGPAGLVITLPITSVGKGIPFHVELKPKEAGLDMRPLVKCEEIRCISKDRLMKRYGKVSDEILEAVEDRIKILLGLHP